MKEILFVIWLSFVFINFLYFAVICAVSASRFKERHPDKKPRKPKPIELILSLITILLLSMIPIFHLVSGFAYIFCYESIIEKSVENLESKIEY